MAFGQLQRHSVLEFQIFDLRLGCELEVSNETAENDFNEHNSKLVAEAVPSPSRERMALGDVFLKEIVRIELVVRNTENNFFAVLITGDCGEHKRVDHQRRLLRNHTARRNLKILHRLSPDEKNRRRQMKTFLHDAIQKVEFRQRFELVEALKFLRKLLLRLFVHREK